MDTTHIVVYGLITVIILVLIAYIMGRADEKNVQRRMHRRLIRYHNQCYHMVGELTSLKPHDRSELDGHLALIISHLNKATLIFVRAIGTQISADKSDSTKEQNSPL